MTKKDSEDYKKIIDQVGKLIQGMRFGSVEIVIHDGKVVQIERREKVRFNKEDERG